MATYMNLREDALIVGIPTVEQVEIPETFNAAELQALWDIRNAFRGGFEATGIKKILALTGNLWEEGARPLVALLRELCRGVEDRCGAGSEWGGRVFRCALPHDHAVGVHFGIYPGSEEWKIW